MLRAMQAKLYVVGTPIGNLEDITLRALRVLGECDLVLCEDTRVTRKLLSHFEITKPLMSYHGHSGSAKYEKVRVLLEEGKQLVVVSDAGTPGISDPGAQLVRYVRDTCGDFASIEAIPGPSAVTTALSVAGVTADSFTFLGFPPHKKGRKTFFKQLTDIATTTVFYESPHRALKALTSVTENCADTTHVIVCRELTKLHEQVVSGTPAEVLEYFTTHPDKVRGEFVVVVAAP